MLAKVSGISWVIGLLTLSGGLFAQEEEEMGATGNKPSGMETPQKPSQGKTPLLDRASAKQSGIWNLLHTLQLSGTL